MKTETVQPKHLTVAPELPENLKEFLNLISAYKAQVNNKATLNTNDPDEVIKVKSQLRMDAKELNELIYTRKNRNAPNHLKKLFDALIPVLKQIRRTDSPVLNNYVQMLYIQFPFTPNHEHVITQLVKNSTQPITDGTDS